MTTKRGVMWVVEERCVGAHWTPISIFKSKRVAENQMMQQPHMARWGLVPMKYRIRRYVAEKVSK